MAIITGLRLSWSNIVFLLVRDFNLTHIYFHAEGSILDTVFFTVVTTHRLEGARLPRHRRRTTRPLRRTLFIHHLGSFVDDNNLSRVFLLLVLQVLLLHNPSRVGELNTSLIWFVDTVHFSRIGETAFPHGITDDFHFLFLVFYIFVPHLGFSSDFSQVNVNLTSKFGASLRGLFGNTILNIDDMFLELLDIYTSGVVDLRLSGNILECIEA